MPDQQDKDFPGFQLTVPVVADMTQAESSLREFERKATESAQKIGKALADALTPKNGDSSLPAPLNSPTASQPTQDDQRDQPSVLDAIRENTSQLRELRDSVDALTEAITASTSMEGLP